MDSVKYYTTPIYYASGIPHLGHIYTTSIMGVLARHYEQRGYKVTTLTGMDEHGEKIAQKASQEGLLPQQYVDRVSATWQQFFEKMELKSSIFLRTTSDAHKDNVKAILKACHKNGDIYFGQHEGFYCTQCEAFLTEKDMDESHFCLIHKVKTELRNEGNYYFKTTKYKSQIKQWAKTQGNVLPSRYSNELLGLLDQLEEDLSISRPKTRTNWGIELPFDSNHVTYVWFDALPNYITGIGGIQNAITSTEWQNCTHLIGKDILKFHGIFWPAMLLSLGIKLPKLMVHGWVLQDGHKMSKSLGNTIGMEEIAELGMDALLNATLRGSNIGEDREISQELLINRFNSDLANGLGNLVSRTFTMAQNYFSGTLTFSKPPEFQNQRRVLWLGAQELESAVHDAFDSYRFELALEEAQKIVQISDKLISDEKPWELAKNPESQDSLKELLGLVIYSTHVLARQLWCFFPKKMQEVLDAVTFSGVSNHSKSKSFPPEIKISFVPKLFQRMEHKKTQAAPPPQPLSSPAPKAAETVSSSSPTTTTIDISQFSAVQIKVGTVVKAETVPNSTKLLRLEVSLGTDCVKQIFSGIKEWVTPESIAGKKVLIVANLAPRKMKFGVSEGMLLSTQSPNGTVVPVFVSAELEDGSLLA
jgi:methionyl-tRNA synthetase